MTIEVIIMGALIIGSFWWKGRIKAERKAKKEADNAAPPNATTAKQAPIAKDNPTAERKPVAASTKIPQSAPAPKPTNAAKPAVAVKPAPTIERAAAATQTPPAKSKPASEPESTAKQALHHQRKDGQSGKSQVPHTDFTLAVQDERTFRNKYILDEKHGYGQKSLWLNYLSLGYVEGNIPAVKYDVIWRANGNYQNSILLSF